MRIQIWGFLPKQQKQFRNCSLLLVCQTDNRQHQIPALLAANEKRLNSAFSIQPEKGNLVEKTDASRRNEDSTDWLNSRPAEVKSLQ